MEIYVARGGQQSGPFPLDEVRRQFAAGELSAEDLGWTEGQTEWVPLRDFPGLNVAGNPAPPLPPSGPAQAAAAIPAAAYIPPAPAAARVDQSGLAIASLILGILGVTAVPVLTSIPAVVCGHMAKSEIRKSGGRIGGEGMATAGLITGYFGIFLFAVVVIAIVAAIALPAFMQARGKAMESRALANGRMIAVACQAYAADNDGNFPPTLQTLVPKYLPDAKILVCALNSPKDTAGFRYFGGRDSDPGDKILLTSEQTGKNGRSVVVRVNSMVQMEHLDTSSLPQPH